jgi:peptidoglycan endopeptidase LytF
MKKILKIPLRRIPRRPPPAESLRAKAAAASAETYDEEDYETEEEPNMKFSHALVVVLALHIIAVGGVFAFNSIKAGQASAKGADSPPAGAAQSKPTPAKGAIEGWAGKTHTVQAGDTLSRIAALYKTSLELLEKENGITSYSMIRVGQVLKVPASAGPVVAPPATDPLTAAAKHAFLAARTDIVKPPVTAVKADIVKPPPAAVKSDVAKPPTAAAKTDIAKPPAATAKTDVTKPAAVAPAAPNPAATAPSPKPAEVPPAPTESDVYVVAKGDNPYNIAKKLHVSYNDLLAINEIKDPTRVQIGQKLKIPAKKN